MCVPVPVAQRRSEGEKYRAAQRNVREQLNVVPPKVLPLRCPIHHALKHKRHGDRHDPQQFHLVEHLTPEQMILKHLIYLRPLSSPTGPRDRA